MALNFDLPDQFKKQKNVSKLNFGWEIVKEFSSGHIQGDKMQIS